VFILLSAIIISTSFAGDDEKMIDSLKDIDSKIQILNEYKAEVALSLKEKVDATNQEITQICDSIPDSIKSAVDCTKFKQDYEITI
jgi:hypothetical protein